jgi:aryl-alcohol dehydrogenase-like predicted oxidoreductase
MTMCLAASVAVSERSCHPFPAFCFLQSVANGWNVVDTAANYRWGRAERSVGQALLTLRMSGAAERDMLFVSTKAGYAAGKSGSAALAEPSAALQSRCCIIDG